MGFVNLHSHTHLSNLRLRDSISTPEDLMSYAKEINHSGIALTEHETVGSALTAEKYLQKMRSQDSSWNDFKLILGNEIYLCRNGLNAENFRKGIDKYYHFILLAKDEIGHQQLRELSTKAWSQSYFSFMRRCPTYYSDIEEIIGKNPGHVIGSSSCLASKVSQSILQYQALGEDDNYWQQLIKWIQLMEQVFTKGNFFLEMQPSNNKEQIYVNNKIITLSNELNIPYIITTDVHYTKKQDRSIHKAFLTSQQGEREVDEFYATTFLMTEEEIHGYMDKHIGSEQVEQAFANTLVISKMCEEYSLQKPLKIPSLSLNGKQLTSLQLNQYTQYPWFYKFATSPNASDRQLAYEIAQKVAAKAEELDNEETWQEIEINLASLWATSEKLGSPWSSYFLYVADIIKLCWEEGDSICAPGRGSGVGYILNYILDITQINPLREKTKTFPWRFINPERASVLDIDSDIEAPKRNKIIAAMEQKYGKDRVSRVATFKTEKGKSAIQTAVRGLGMEPEIGQYLSSFLSAERGILQTLDQAFYGDEENDIKPNKNFVYEMTENYPEVWKVARKIENLINGMSSHAGGVILVDEPFTNTTALMKTNSGDTITQFDLHQSEEQSLLKIDLLSTEALSKIRTCLDLLVEYGYIDGSLSLRERYEKAIGIYTLERDDLNMWKKLWDHEVISFFQMEQMSGIKAVALTQPENVDDLAIINSCMRLMAPEKGAEQPLDMYARYKRDINVWYDEMTEKGLTQKEQEILKKHLNISYGMCITQEQLMILLQEPCLGGHSLATVDAVRKSIAKKQPEQFLKHQEMFYQVMEEKQLSSILCHYVWDELFRVQRGYSFAASHSLAYSLIGLQELNLAYKYPSLFWQTANLIVDSAGVEKEVQLEEDDEFNDTNLISEFDQFEDLDDYEEDDEDDSLTDPKTAAKVKKKAPQTVDYGKIASAIGKYQMEGIKISPPNINKSTFSFTPDVEKNEILYGVRGIAKVGLDLVKNIIANRPYSSLEDFLERIKISKDRVIMLIKAGAFDTISDVPRDELLARFIRLSSKPKNKITLANTPLLIELNLIPKELDRARRVYNCNKYLSKHQDKVNELYMVDEKTFQFITEVLKLTTLVFLESNNGYLGYMTKSDWTKVYKTETAHLSSWIKEAQQHLLEQVNEQLFKEEWEKYNSSAYSTAHGEMQSLASYLTQSHELSRIDRNLYEIDNFFELSPEPTIGYSFTTKTNYQVDMYELNRICGTVIDKDKSHNSITLLTPDGVVQVKIWASQFQKYDRQLFEKLPNGKKHIIEKSWFTRGNLLVITGIRRDSVFIPKVYKRSKYSYPIEKIESINSSGQITTSNSRFEGEDS